MCVTQIHNSVHAFFQIRVYSITQLPQKLCCCLAATSLISQASRTTHLTDLCKSSLHLKKPTTQACSAVSRKENPEIRSPEAVPRASVVSEKTPTRRLRFPDFHIVFVHTRRHDGLVDHQFAYWRNMAFNWCCTRLHAPPGFLASPPRAGEHCTLLPSVDSAADVIWRHMMTSSLHVSSHASTSTSALVHVIGWRHQIYCLTRDPTRKPRTDPDQYPLTLTMDQLTLTFCVDLWPKVKISNMAYFAQFFA